MSASTVYGGGSLWLANGNGVVACADPATGRIRALERVPLGGIITQLLAADHASGSIVALGQHKLVHITPPRQCWAAST
ncbi:MAG: hypothetical protein ACM3ML_30290 [Micromonosporaceae bacterium]